MDGISQATGSVQAAIATSMLSKVMGQSEQIIEELMTALPEMNLDVGASTTLGTNLDLYV